MTPFILFKLVQGCIGRKYNGTKGQFESANFYNYYKTLCSILNEKFEGSDARLRQYISVISKLEGERLDPFQLSSDEYFKLFKEWLKVHGSENSYKINIFNSCQFVFKFSKERNIYSLNEYIKKWGVSHLISGKLNENVAFVMGLQNVMLTKPEKMAINKTFLKNTGIISERLKREHHIKEFIEKNLSKIQNKLNIINSQNTL